MTDTRVEMRIVRLRRRVARLERGLALLERWDENKYRPLRAFILEILDEDPDATDEEIVDALVEKADELARFQGLRELITDASIRVAAEVGLWAHRNRKRLIEGRLARLRKRIAALEKSQAKPRPRPGRARAALRQDARAAQEVPSGPTEQAMFAQLGMSEEFYQPSKRAKSGTRRAKGK